MGVAASIFRRELCSIYDGVAAAEPSVQVKEVPSRLLEALPKDLVCMISNYSTFADWTYLTGLFHPNCSKSLIEESAKRRLKSLELRLSPSQSARTQLLTHIFTEAFTEAPLKEQKRIIHCAQALQPRLEVTSSRMKEIWIEGSSMIHRVVLSSFVRTCAGIYAAIVAFKVALIGVAFLVTVGFPWIASYCPSLFVKVMGALVKNWAEISCIQILFNYLRKLYYGPHVQHNETVDRLFRVLLFPGRAFILIYFLSPFAVSFGAFRLARGILGRTEESLRAYNEDLSAAWLQAEEEKALQTWLELDHAIYQQQNS